MLKLSVSSDAIAWSGVRSMLLHLRIVHETFRTLERLARVPSGRCPQPAGKELTRHDDLGLGRFILLFSQ